MKKAEAKKLKKRMSRDEIHHRMMLRNIRKNPEHHTINEWVTSGRIMELPFLDLGTLYPFEERLKMDS